MRGWCRRPTDAIEPAGLRFILGVKITHVPYLVRAWRKDHPDTEIQDGHVFTQPRRPGPNDKRRDQVIYQHKDRPGTAHTTRDRRADHQGRESRRRHGTGKPQGGALALWRRSRLGVRPLCCAEQARARLRPPGVYLGG
jgi:hypothetical protein